MSKNESPNKKRKVSDIYQETVTKTNNPTPAEDSEDKFEMISKEEAIAEQKKAGMGLSDYTMIKDKTKKGWTPEDEQLLNGEYEEVEAPKKKDNEDKSGEKK